MEIKLITQHNGDCVGPTSLRQYTAAVLVSAETDLMPGQVVTRGDIEPHTDAMQ